MNESKEHPNPVTLDVKPSVIEGLTGERDRSHSELVPLPRFTVLGDAVHPDNRRRNARNPIRFRLCHDLGDGGIGVGWTFEALLKLRHGVDVIVVVVGNPQAGDALDLSLFEEAFQQVDDARRAAIHDKRLARLAEQYPCRFKVAQKIGHLFRRTRRKVILSVGVVGEHVRKVIPKSRSRHVAVVGDFESFFESFHRATRFPKNVSVRGNERIGCDGEDGIKASQDLFPRAQKTLRVR